MSGDSGHIPFEILLDLVEERIAPGRRAAVQAHVKACAECEKDLAWLSRITTTMRADQLEDAPPHVIARAVRALGRAPAPRPGVLQRISAQLRFDSGATFAPAFGMRSGQPQGRQLLFAADDVEIDLHITPANNRWLVSGQMLGPCEGGSVELLSVDTRQSTPLNELCEFSLPPVDANEYTLLLRYAEVEVEVSPLLIGEGNGEG